MASRRTESNYRDRQFFCGTDGSSSTQKLSAFMETVRIFFYLVHNGTFLGPILVEINWIHTQALSFVYDLSSHFNRWWICLPACWT